MESEGGDPGDVYPAPPLRGEARGCPSVCAHPVRWRVAAQYLIKELCLPALFFRISDAVSGGSPQQSPCVSDPKVAGRGGRGLLAPAQVGVRGCFSGDRALL